jgi:hypothetical protein
MNTTLFEFQQQQQKEYYCSSCELLLLGLFSQQLLLFLSSKVVISSSLEAILYAQQQATRDLPSCVSQYLENNHILLATPSLVDQQDYDIINRSLIYQYTAGLDRSINWQLRSQAGDKVITSLITRLTMTIDHCPKSQPILYRGIKPYFEPKVGQVYPDRAFMSKSTRFEVAEQYAINNCCIFLMSYSKPTRHCNISSVSKYPQEAEYLTYPGESCTIINYYNIFRPSTNRLVKVYHY